MALSNPKTQQRWADFAEEDGAESVEIELRPPVVTGPDKSGMKKVVEYKLRADGKKVKITRTFRVVYLSKRALERREWAKFGDAANEDDVNESRTVVSTEEIRLERPGGKTEEKKAPGDPSSQGGFIMVCRCCGKKGDHWTSRCPYKDLNQPTESFTDRPPTSDAKTTGGGTKGTYIPPSKRLGADKSSITTDMRRRNDENSVKVSNLSEDTREADLHELFGSFGPLTRTYVVMDKGNGVSRGFGFVNFQDREDAQNAINKLNGYGYDNLILHVEWAPPRSY